MSVVRVAAVGDIHMDADRAGLFRRSLLRVSHRADLLLLAGDLTQRGTVAEARWVANEIDGIGVPVVAVLGNHEFFNGEAAEVAAVLVEAGVRLLEETTTVVACGDVRVGVAGMMGYLGGFAEVAEPADDRASRFAALLLGLDCDLVVALTHYAPVADTLAGEPHRLYPVLGSATMGVALDLARPHLAIHGHAHFGIEHGTTAGGVPVRNVAFPVIGQAYRVYRVDTDAPPGAQIHTMAHRRPARRSRWTSRRGAAGP